MLHVSNDQTIVLPENRKKVSVLICVVAHIATDRQRLLFERTIESLLALETPVDIKVDIEASILVVDNASVFPIRDLVSPKTGALIEVQRRTANNIGAARTMGLRAALAANCEWIAYVDSDVELAVEWLTILIRELQTAPMRDAVGIATVNRPPHEGDFSKALDFFLGFEHTHLGSTQMLQLRSSTHEAITKQKVNHLATCAAILHVKALEHAGGFDRDFSRVCEDLEMSYRLRKNGSLWLLSAPVALHRQDRNWQGWGKRMFRYGWGQIEVARRHHEHLKTRKVIPLLAGLWVVIAIVLYLFGPAVPLRLTLVGYLGFMMAPIILRGISEGRMDTAFQACWLAFVTHCAYAAGMWAGLLRLRQNPTTIQPGD